MITEILIGLILQIISSLGYAGIFVLMLAESTFLPVPSEGVLPFAGYLIAQAKFDLLLTIAVATLGTIAGSLISYFIGKYLGRAIVSRYGKYFFVSEHDLELAHKWFVRHGEKTIFICRFIPVVRHLISLPAGAAKMNLKKFLAYTFLGGLIWNSFLIFVGIELQQNWNTILNYTQYLDVLALAAIVVLIAWLLFKKK